MLIRESDMRDLGIYFDNKLSFNNHINIIHDACIRTLGCPDFKNAKTLILLYYSLIRSKLEFASLIWDPHQSNQINKIERVQKKFVKQLFYRKLIRKAPADWNYLKCCELLKTDTLEKRRIVNGISFAIKSFKNITDGQSSKFLNHIMV